MGGLEGVSDDVWVDHLAPLLVQRDLASVAMCCAELRGTMDRVRCRRGIRVRQDGCDMLEDPRWAALTALDVRGMSWRYVTRPLPVLRVESVTALAALRALHLHNPRMPARPVWPAVFGACPALRDVKFYGDFYMHNYARDVHHCIDLLEHGAPRLERLDMEGGWMTFCHSESSHDTDIRRAVIRMHSTPAVRSDTLRAFRAACKQVTVGVDAPLHSLVIDDSPYPPVAIKRMGPVALACTETLAWKSMWSRFDGAHLACFARLASADIRVGGLRYATRVSACMASLAHLPTSLRSLRVRLDTWWMEPDESGVAWGEPLRHLGALTDLELDITFPPLTVGELLGGWMGARPSIRRVRARFQHAAVQSLEREYDTLVGEGADVEDEIVQGLCAAMARVSHRVDPSGLSAWLDRHPGAVASVEGLHDRFECDHPRCTFEM